MFKFYKVIGRYETIVIAKKEEEAIKEYRRRFEKNKDIKVKEITREEAIEQHMKQVEKCARDFGAYVLGIKYLNK